MWNRVHVKARPLDASLGDESVSNRMNIDGLIVSLIVFALPYKRLSRCLLSCWPERGRIGRDNHLARWSWPYTLAYSSALSPNHTLSVQSQLICINDKHQSCGQSVTASDSQGLRCIFIYVSSKSSTSHCFLLDQA